MPTTSFRSTAWIVARLRGLPALLLATQVVTASSSLIVNVIAARAMGPDGRGALALYLQLSYVASAVLLLGIDRSFPAKSGPIARWRQAYRQLVSLTAPGVALVAGVILLATVFGSVTNLAGWPGLALFALTVGNSGLVGMRSSAMTTGRGLSLLIATSVVQAALIGSSVLLAGAGQAEPIWWLWAYAAATIVPCALVWAGGQRKSAESLSRQDRHVLRRYGLRLLPAVLANIVMLRSDRLLLPALSGAEQLGLYIVVAAIAELIAWPVQSWVDANLRKWSDWSAAGVLRPEKLLVVTFAYALLAVACVGTSANLLLLPLFGAEYRDSLELVWPLAAASGLYAVSRCGLGLAVASGSARNAALADVGGMLFAAALYVAFIPSHGALGAAWGSLVGYGFSALVSSFLAVVSSKGTGRVPPVRERPHEGGGSRDDLALRGAGPTWSLGWRKR